MPRLPRSVWPTTVKPLLVPGMDGLPIVVVGPAAAPAGRLLTARPERAAARPRRRAMAGTTAGTAAPGSEVVTPSLSPYSSRFLPAYATDTGAGQRTSYTGRYRSYVVTISVSRRVKNIAGQKLMSSPSRAAPRATMAMLT